MEILTANETELIDRFNIVLVHEEFSKCQLSIFNNNV